MNLFHKLFIKLSLGAAKEAKQQIEKQSAEAQKRRENAIREIQAKIDLPEVKKTENAETAPVTVISPTVEKEPVKAVPEGTETKAVTTLTEAEESDPLKNIKFEAPNILRPVQFTAVPQKIPAVQLTSKEAVEMGYSFRKSSKSVKITGFHGQAPQKLIIPCSIASLPVEEICPEVFKKAELNEVFIPDSIRKLGKEAFCCSTVKKVVFGEGLSSIPEKTFMGCDKLEQIILPTTLHHIGQEAFWQCYALKHIDLPKNVSQIDDYAFSASGLESFGVEVEKNHITNANAFCQTRMYWNYDIISTSLLSSELKVLRVRSDKALKPIADKVEFLPHSIVDGTCLDLTECRKVSFWRMARPRQWYDYRYNDKCIIKLPDSIKKGSLAFLADYVELYDSLVKKIPHDLFVVNAPYDPEDLEEWEITEDKPYDYDMIYGFLPQYGLRTEHKKIYVDCYDIAENAIDSSALEEIEFYLFKPEGRIFTNNCTNLRKVSWNDGKGTITKYLPPDKLFNKYLKIALLNAFSPCSGPYGRSNDHGLPGYKRTVFNREVIDSIFRERKVCARDNPYVKRALPPMSDPDKTITVSNKFKALVAVDVLRSDKMPHEPDTKMYSDFLRTNFGFCYKFFAQISNEFPEYADALKDLR